jgi:hypothetical protein
LKYIIYWFSLCYFFCLFFIPFFSHVLIESLLYARHQNIIPLRPHFLMWLYAFLLHHFNVYCLLNHWGGCGGELGIFCILWAQTITCSTLRICIQENIHPILFSSQSRNTIRIENDKKNTRKKLSYWSSGIILSDTIYDRLISIVFPKVIILNSFYLYFQVT